MSSDALAPNQRNNKTVYGFHLLDILLTISLRFCKLIDIYKILCDEMRFQSIAKETYRQSRFSTFYTYLLPII